MTRIPAAFKDRRLPAEIDRISLFPQRFEGPTVKLVKVFGHLVGRMADHVVVSKKGLATIRVSCAREIETSLRFSGTVQLVGVFKDDEENGHA